MTLGGESLVLTFYQFKIDQYIDKPLDGRV